MSDPCATHLRAPLVSIEQATVDIQGHRVLEDVSLDVHAGEHWGIVGANGSGKSTLLRVIEGTMWPVPGRGRRRYDFGNGIRTDAIEARRRVVTVGPELQNRYVRFGWNFRTIDVARSGITRSDVPRRNPGPAEVDAATRIVARLGLASLSGRRFLELSRGQQRRVLVARALGFAPALLLLDEPASGLDADARRDLDELLAEIAGSTTIVTTAHSDDDLPAIVTHVLRLEGGRARLERRPPIPSLEPAANTDPGPQLSSTGSRPGGDPMPPPGDVGARTRISTVTSTSPASVTDHDTLIRVEHASVYYDGKAVLDRIDWRLRAGEQWLITGPNGSGKSSFLRLLHGQLRPAVGGSVSWPGLGDPADVWKLRRQIGLVSAELMAAYRYPANVRDAIGSGIDSSFGLTRALTAGETGRVDALLERFALSTLADRRLSTLSYGQLHRTMIARTLANGPRVVLLDEPWEGLDPATRALVARAINAEIERGLGVVCASHIEDRGIHFNRRLRLSAGRISDACADA